MVLALADTRASDWPLLQAAIARWAALNILPDDVWEELRATYEHKAGLLAGIWDQTFTEKFLESIESAMAAGQDYATWLPEGQAIVAEFGSDVVLAGADVAGVLPQAYAEMVYRMAAASAAAGGRYAQMFTPGRTQTDPYVMYSTQEDDRVRPEHAEIDGMVFSKNDANARALFPPSDYNCRCYLIELDKNDLEDGGHPVASGGDFERPPEGFNVDRVQELAPPALTREPPHEG